MTQTTDQTIDPNEAPAGIVGTQTEPTALIQPAIVVRQAIEDHLHVVEQLILQQELIESIAERMVETILAGGKVLWCGNGGSAADCQHLAAEFVGRFRRERRGLASVALTTDSSVLTAIGNDYGYDEVFSRQVEALCTPQDVVVGISTSGNSKNVCAALKGANDIGAFTVCFTGLGGGELAGIANASLKVASKDTARIQEAHILVGHMLCDWVELAVCSKDARTEGGHR
jgi:D-sedoheptulose 7-phosphate isomerase